MMLTRVWRWLKRQFAAVVIGLGLAMGLGAAAHAVPPPVAVRAFAMASLPGGAPTPQERERAQERARRGRLLFLVSQLYQSALLAGFLLLGGTRWLARLTARFGHWAPALAVVAAVVGIGSTLFTLPLEYYTGFIFQHQYGLSNQTPPQWLRDYLVGQGVGIAVGAPLLFLFYALLRHAARTWWLWLGAASAPISIFLMLISPVYIAPLFNTFTPLRDAELRRDILAMAHAQGIAADDVYQVDASRQSNAVNAYVNGFGPTQRIVLYDTLLKYFTPDEIKFVMAHEMGHYVLGHIRQGILFSILGTLVAGLTLACVAGWLLRRWGGQLGFAALGHPASLPLLMLLGMVLSLLALPLGNAVSRQMEWQADRYATRVYPHRQAGISAYHKLARLNVAEEDPPRWVEVIFYSHPSLARRIAALEAE